MPMTDVDYNRLLVRATKLERQNRFWKMAGLLVLLRVFLSFGAKVRAQDAVLPPTPPLPTTLEARTFVLKDSAGIMRGKMTVDGDRHPALEFYDLDGNVTWSTDSRAIPAK
jgi:hypothetical protein